MAEMGFSVRQIVHLYDYKFLYFKKGQQFVHSLYKYASSQKGFEKKENFAYAYMVGDNTQIVLEENGGCDLVHVKDIDTSINSWIDSLNKELSDYSKGNTMAFLKNMYTEPFVDFYHLCKTKFA